MRKKEKSLVVIGKNYLYHKLRSILPSSFIYYYVVAAVVLGSKMTPSCFFLAFTATATATTKVQKLTKAIIVNHRQEGGFIS